MVQEQSHNIPAIDDMAADFGPNKGKIIIADHVINFENVPLVTPNGDVLIRALNFEVHSGQNVLVAGPNGCGKSSVWNTLGGDTVADSAVLVVPYTWWIVACFWRHTNKAI